MSSRHTGLFFSLLTLAALAGLLVLVQTGFYSCKHVNIGT
jgi:hypothetical protein